MKNVIRLTKVLTRANSMDESNDKMRKAQIAIISFCAFVFIFIPIVAGAGIFTYLMTKSLISAGDPGFGIRMMYGLISVFTLIFGVNVIFNELYFSTDIEHLLPLPLKAREIVLAKFSAAFMGENVMQFMLVLAVTVGYGAALRMSIPMWILSLLGGFILPICPMAACAVVGMLLMGITPVVRSKKAVRAVSLVIILLVMGFGIWTLLSLKTADVEEFVLSASKGDIPFINVLNIFFPQTGLISDYMSGGGILKFLLYIALNAAAIAILTIMAELLYMRSVTGMTEGERGSAKKVSISGGSEKRAVWHSLLLKDIRTLLRTTVFMTNSVGVTFIWPVMVWVTCRILDFDLASLRGAGDDRLIWVVIAASAVVYIMGAMNSLGSNAFSREGSGFDFMKYIPIPLETQWNVKAAVSIVITLAGTVPFTAAYLIFMHVGPLVSLAAMLGQIAASVMVTYFGMLLDSMNPKLVWEDALSALRENYNTFFCMGGCMIYAALLSFAMWLLGRQIGAAGAGLLGALFTAVIDVLLIRLSMTKGIENLRKVGEV